MRVAVETYGCTMNQADSDIIRAYLSKDFVLSNLEEADVVVINSCGVIDFTERKIIRRMIELKNAGKKVVLAGCLSRISKNALELADSAISPDNLDKIVEAVNSTFNGGVRFLEWRDVDKSCLPKLRSEENAIAIVSISEGCVGHCSFCATKFARGKLRSFGISGILEEVERVVKQGFKEIQLTSQDTGCYGLDRGDFLLPKLLEGISRIEGDFRVRVGMMNPQHAKEQIERLLEVFESEKIFKFLHIPVQSGDNNVLEHMKRDHTVEDFLEVVDAFRNKFEITLATDIIVGYPTETEESFWKTYDLIEEVRPDIVNITRFSRRKGTPAERLKEIPGWIVKKRSRNLTELCIRIGLENNREFLGKKLEVLITSQGKRWMLARTNSYRAVITTGKLGEFKEVKIGACRHNYLLDEELSEHESSQSLRSLEV
ncbi:MAG: tRNA (N(6)-L-threonylcarbamoyladenosine(37)-C(2))-methylthiotransferase [Archaeoglobaceae archaeon]|nr:tRNA (N(6)-L-threonylcarbamoyladenosine(37)-C(2))-methylthiotransferase [Archaeoglobaceae archaeon]MDW8117968.1 tRNA (N(6)-L-threonylcarbamoyladenosine(37)-C(2))-methylthiotransferase [Archaeoglobaceae archaeon]